MQALGSQALGAPDNSKFYDNVLGIKDGARIQQKNMENLDSKLIIGQDRV